MATTARDEIIADWRKSLADAEEPLSPDSPRTAWLTRLKLRLYRFLLSIYGDGRWNASDFTAQDGENMGRVVIREDAMPFSGKAAKDEHQIRSALQSVAEASDVRIQPGPMAQGVKRHELGLVQFVAERSRFQRVDHQESGRHGALISYLCLAAMVATVFVLISVATLSVARAPGMNPANQVLLRQVSVVTLGCFLISAMMYGIFAVRPRKRK